MIVPKIYPLSETALTIEWGNSIDEAIRQQVVHANDLLNQNPFAGFIETVPAYTTLTVYYQPELIVEENDSSFSFVKNYIEALLVKAPDKEIQKGNIIAIPVCYDVEFGYDLEFVAETNGLSKEEVIDLHQQKEYTVYMMGFLPGFAYMGSVDDAIATARKSMPRSLVEAGSVGIAGKQTGIYPLSSPGGWQIVGRTPYCLFDLQKTDPFLFKTGDAVQFYSISKEEYHKIKNTQDLTTGIEQEKDIADAVIMKPGIFSTIQDGGRLGFRAYGVPLSGAMDDLAHYTANGLVGNTKNAASIECTMGSLLMQFKKNAIVAVTGSGMAFVNGQKIKLYQPLSVDANDSLEIKYNNDGIRTYIAVRGGFAGTVMMNSKSVCANGEIGMPLKKEQELQFDSSSANISKRITDNLQIPVHTTAANIRVIAGAESNRLATGSIWQFYSQKFMLSNRCDRMGYHLQSDPLILNNTTELLSTAVTKGTIQVTPGGQLIVLMSDCQTTGGYPRVAQVAAVDLPLIAQLKPGDAIQFTNISHAEAEELYLVQQKMINGFFS